DLTCRGEDDARGRVRATTCLEDRELALAVDLEVRMRVDHRVEVTRLSCEVEDEVLPAHEVLHRMLVADVGDVDDHPIPNVGDVVEVPAVFGDERVDEQDLGAVLDEAMGQRRPEEPETARDHDPAASEPAPRVLHDVARRARAHVAAILSAERAQKATPMPAPGYQWSRGTSRKNKKRRPVRRAKARSSSVTCALSARMTACSERRGR